MALPWTAPGFGQGVYPGDAPFYIPKPVDPSIIAQITRDRERQQAQIQDALSSVGEFLKQRQQDQLANQIMNQYAPPRAAAVNPAAYDPALAASQGLNYAGTPVDQPASQDFINPTPVAGPAATPAFTGGADALNAFMKARQLQSQDVNDALKQQLDVAKIGWYGRRGTPTAGPGGSSTPTIDPATGLIWNGRQWVKPPAGPKTPVADIGAAKATKEMAEFGLSPTDLNNLDVSQSDIIPAKGNSPQKMGVVTKDGRQATVPWATWQKWSNFINKGGLSPTQPGTPQPSQPTRQTAPPAAIDYLQAHPEVKDQFFAKYGYLP